MMIPKIASRGQAGTEPGSKITSNGIDMPQVKKLDTKKVLRQRIDKGMSTREIAASNGVCHQAVSQLLQRVNTSDILAIYTNKRADAYTILEHDILNSIDDEDVKKASLLQKVTAAGILKTHHNLETGKATDIIDYRGLNVNATLQAIRERVNNTQVEGNEQEEAKTADPPVFDISPNCK
jgi:predicted DNA-binding protein YlxM (UPF0122 family)